MYPHFVKIIENNLFNDSQILEICGQRYIAHANDRFIGTAIALAGCWQSHQVTYARVLHLRKWIRLNEDLQVPETGVGSLLGCKEFIDRVIGALFVMTPGRDCEKYIEQLRENDRIFFEEELIDAA